MKNKMIYNKTYFIIFNIMFIIITILNLYNTFYINTEDIIWQFRSYIFLLIQQIIYINSYYNKLTIELINILYKATNVLSFVIYGYLYTIGFFNVNNIMKLNCLILMCKTIMQFIYNYINKFEICSICLNNYQIDNSILQLECNHIFHTNCINEWLNIKSSCPYCRKSI